jgi:hypothetical protein
MKFNSWKVNKLIIIVFNKLHCLDELEPILIKKAVYSFLIVVTNIECNVNVGH